MERGRGRSAQEWRAELCLPSGTIACTVRQSARARRLRLMIDHRDAAIVTVPYRLARSRAAAERLAQTFAGEREAWLRRHLERRAIQQRTLAARGPLRDGVMVDFRGQPHRLRVVEIEPRPRRTTVSRVGAEEGDELVVCLGRTERRGLPVILEAWLRDRARVVVEREIERHAASLGVLPGGIAIRDQRTRWGSCSRAGRLSFSWRLVVAPPGALETVVVHELAHLRVFGHGQRFWELVAAHQPDHLRWRRWLRTHAVELHGTLAERPAEAEIAGRALGDVRPAALF